MIVDEATRMLTQRQEPVSYAAGRRSTRSARECAAGPDDMGGPRGRGRVGRYECSFESYRACVDEVCGQMGSTVTRPAAHMLGDDPDAAAGITGLLRSNTDRVSFADGYPSDGEYRLVDVLQKKTTGGGTGSPRRRAGGAAAETRFRDIVLGGADAVGRRRLERTSG